MLKKIIFALILCCLFASKAFAWEVGSVDTEVKLLGSNHKVVVFGFKDPDYPDIMCHMSQAVKGGITGSLGLAEDPSQFSVDCELKSNVKIVPTNTSQKQVFNEKTSFLFKNTEVYRMYDKESNSFVYLAVSRKMINGSPKNSVSSVYLGD